MKRLDSRSRAFVRLGIEQLFFQIEGQGQAMPAMAPAAMSGMGVGGMGAGPNYTNHMSYGKSFKASETDLGMNAAEYTQGHW